MRPRQVCRGKVPSVEYLVKGIQSFNEAPASLPGKEIENC